MLQKAPVSPVWVASLTPKGIDGVIALNGENLRPRLTAAVSEAQTPLRRRLERVGGRIAAAAGRPDITFVLDPSVGLNAVAPAGLHSQGIFVGPSLVILAESEGELAMALG